MESQLLPPRQQFNLLQVFRGIAALLVLFFHIHHIGKEKLTQESFFEIFKFGMHGVDFFFVLSGFIIFYIHRADIGNKKKLKSFILKRLVRIYPIYWVVSAPVLIVSIVWPSLNKGFNPSDVLPSLLLFPKRDVLLNVSWTLTYEVFFYIFFTFLIFLGIKRCMPVIICWFLGILFRQIGVFKIGSGAELLDFLFSTYHLEFFAGCLAAYLVAAKIRYGRFMLYTGGTLFILLGLCVSYDWVNVKSIIFGIPAFLIVIGSASIETKKTLDIAPFWLYIGDASYSIYLTHGPVLSVLIGLIAKAKLGTIETNCLLMLAGLVALGIGCACYSFIEKRLLKYSREKLGLAKAKKPSISASDV